MEFVQTGSRFATSLNPITNRANTWKAMPTHRGIARPVALKSTVSSPDTMQGFDEKDSQLERPPITNDGHFPKKLCVWPTNPVSAGLGRTLTGFESSKTWVDYYRHFPHDKDYHLAGNLPKPFTKDSGQVSTNTISHGSEMGGKQDAASSIEGKLPQHAPSVDALATTTGGTGESKRSAFREVARRHEAGLYDQCTSPSTCSSSSSSASSSLLRQRGVELVRDHPHGMLSDKTLPYGLNSAISAHTPLPPNQLFDNTSSQPMSSMGGSVLPHNGTELREPFRAPSLIPVKQQLHADFVKHIPDRNPYSSPGSKVPQINTNPIRDTSGLHFGAFQNNAPTGKILNSLPVPWQQPMFPAGVLPLSSSLSTPQYDNWCAKCNASFRMTSDLVYHMRTQHKRSADAKSANNDKPGARRSAEEKLKCDFCGETFRERHHLTRHMTSHNNKE